MRSAPGRSFALLTVLAAVAFAAPQSVEGQGRTHAVIVVGLGGEARYREAFNAQALQIRSALVERHGLPAEDVVYLGERTDLAPGIMADRSTRANVLKVLGEIAQGSAALDRLLVVMIGHGNTDSGETRFNLPGPDLTPADFQMGLMAFPTQSLALVHTGSASGGFIAPLSGPNRIIVTATRSGREQNATEFAQYFTSAISSDDADLDKDERVSLLEAFLFTRREVERYYDDENELLTEHAVLDDNGDGEASHDASVTGPDGMLAATFHLGGISGTAGQVPDDPELARLYEERTEIQEQIAGLRAIQDSMEEDAYLAAMEEILIELALKNREIRAAEGGGE